jgi:hypothetical protein
MRYMLSFEEEFGHIAWHWHPCEFYILLSLEIRASEVKQLALINVDC